MPPSSSETGLAQRVRAPGYTPGIRGLGALLALFEEDDEDLAKATEQAIARIETMHLPRILEGILGALETAKRPSRGRLARTLGRVAATAPTPTEAGLAVAKARAWLTKALGDSDPKTRHASARALGKLKPADPGERASVEQALLNAWDVGTSDDQRALADALGKVGSEAARARLNVAATSASGASPSGLAQKATRAALMIDRGTARDKPGAIEPTQRADAPLTVRFHSRTGLEAIVSRELGDSWHPRVAGPGRVDAKLAGPLASALSVRTALHVGFPLDAVPVRGEIAEAVVRAMTEPRALAIFRAFTRTDGGPIRFRLAWTHGGHRRALAWRCAELMAAATKELVNDPTESTWEVLVDDYRDRVSIELVPRGFVDPRFAYRSSTVPASSHPTIAAALARSVAARPDDVVWDPFVGAGAELVERARFGAYASLTGTDIDREAIDAARFNLANAGIEGATLSVADAMTVEPKDVTLIVTNPPMGRRVQRGTHGALLERFVDHAARVLVPGGALVWAAPEASLNARAERAGLVLEATSTVDMGGFPAELSVLRKPSAR